MKYDMTLTNELKKYVEEQGIDVFGIADVNVLNAKGRQGRRPQDLFPEGKAILIFGCGMLDNFSRGWIVNGKGGEFLALTLLELEHRKMLLKSWLKHHGYHTYGGGVYGDGALHLGIRLGEAAASCGMGYIGKSNLLITPKYGPRVNLLYLATDAPLKADVVKNDNQCGDCQICEKACLSGAIMGDGYFHARQCESIINCHPNKRYYSKYVNQDCDRCLRVCPKGEIHWERTSYEAKLE